LWGKCYEAQTESFKEWVRSGFAIVPGKALSVVKRDLSEGLSTGLSRRKAKQASKYILGDFVQVVRGVANWRK